MNYGIIKKIAKDKKLSIKMLAKLCGMTEAGLYQAMNNKTLKIETLEKIAEILGVSITIFFESEMDREDAEQINELELPEPIEPEPTIGIMNLDVPEKEKISMLRERVSFLSIKLKLTEQILEATTQHNESLKRQIASLVKSS
jgi:transcriptional regulator with XRE-family HTH domain